MAWRDMGLSGTQVFSHDESRLGTLADMVIEEINGRVMGHEYRAALHSIH